MSNNFFKALKKYAGIKGLDLNENKVKEDLNESDSHNHSDSQVEIKKSHDLEKQISVEIVAEPEEPDAHGHWYSQETVQKGYESADKAWREGRLNMNLFHEFDDTTKQNVELLKHYVVPFDCEVNGQNVKEGTWVAEVKWHNSELWKERITPQEDGMPNIAGLSLRGWGVVNEAKSQEQ